MEYAGYVQGYKPLDWSKKTGEVAQNLRKIEAGREEKREKLDKLYSDNSKLIGDVELGLDPSFDNVILNQTMEAKRMVYDAYKKMRRNEISPRQYKIMMQNMSSGIGEFSNFVKNKNKRFAEAEKMDLQCVLLYCGDHDPDGLRISEFIRKNLSDLKNIKWSDYSFGYDPQDLIIDRFGLNYDFIEKNKFTWIDNLITGSGKNLANPSHNNFKLPYVQKYLKEIGERKCEANAIIVFPQIARDFVRDVIEGYLGNEAKNRFQLKRQQVHDELNKFLTDSGSDLLLEEIFEKIHNR